MPELRYYTVRYEAMVKPWFGKARPQVREITFAAHDVAELLWLSRDYLRQFRHGAKFMDFKEAERG